MQSARGSLPYLWTPELDVRAGEATQPHPRFIYVTPSHQFPLGTTMTMQRRAQLLALASKVDAWVFEDDYDSEFRYSGRPLPALQGLDEENRVIYAGTFSKGLLPSLRLGYLVVPANLVDAFQNAHAVAGVHGSLVDQAVVADFIREGHFARHIRRMRRLYATRRELLVASLRRHLGSMIDVTLPSSGTHVVVGLPAGISDVDACQAAAANGVVTTPLSSAYIGTGPSGFARLCECQGSIDRARGATARFGDPIAGGRRSLSSCRLKEAVIPSERSESKESQSSR